MRFAVCLLAVFTSAHNWQNIATKDEVDTYGARNESKQQELPSTLVFKLFPLPMSMP